MTRRTSTIEPQAAAVRALRTVPNVGPAIAADLIRLGITAPADLADQDADDLYARLCALDGQRHDPCVLDTFTAAIHFVREGDARPWWHFTPARKARLAAKSG